MQRHEMRLKPKPFQAIWDGRKTIELRLFDEKRQALQLGDQITFMEQPGNRQITVEITHLHRYTSFAELYLALNMEKCGYEPGEQAHHQDMLEYYPAEEQAKYGVVGIEFVRKTRCEMP